MIRQWRFGDSYKRCAFQTVLKAITPLQCLLSRWEQPVSNVATQDNKEENGDTLKKLCKDLFPLLTDYGL